MGKIIAFIPVRGGSKSIPKKNIKLFCGKPLVYWTLAALHQTQSVNAIVVATDSDEIEETVKAFNFSNVNVYRRQPQNATDSASTESVMLEYLEASKCDENAVFMLVQATSPLTESKHFAEAIELFKRGEMDSLLTCVRVLRFFWQEDGSPLNYDYTKRPRRQDFNGTLMENGAFYLNTVKNILHHKNRLSGKIGIYEMPVYTATEIDEPDDWAELEKLMYRYVLKTPSTKNIKVVLTDVDGVLTDAGMYYSEAGEELKKFNTHDGMAFQLLREAGIKTGIITSEDTKLVERRAKKLKTDYLYQGKREGGKLAAALEICAKEKIDISQVAYIGDDINCYDLLAAVGHAFCPSSALAKIKQIPGICVLEKRGGDGCFREMTTHIL